MAKRTQDQPAEQERVSRREYLLQRRKAEERRRAITIMVVVVGLLALVLAAGIIIESLVTPRRPVATVNGQTITLGDWQSRVRYQRASLIIFIEDQVEAFIDPEATDPRQAELQAISFVQQFLGQQIVALTQQPEALGEFVLGQMIDDLLIQQEAERRGITVTEDEINARIARRFNYFDGASPTATPTATPTVMPTPSLTPIPQTTITATLEPVPTFTPGPTRTPAPTPTAVSQEAFQTQQREELARFRRMGVSEETYRAVVRAELYREKLADDLAVTEEMSTTDEFLNFYYISADTRAEAELLQERIQATGYVTVWNEIRSGVLPESAIPAAPADGDDGEGEDDAATGATEQPAEPQSTAVALELQNRTATELQDRFGSEMVERLQVLPIGVPSDIITDGDEVSGLTAAGGPIKFYVVQVSGRDVRELSQPALEARQSELLNEWLEEAAINQSVERTDLWRTRVPRQPILDPKFLQVQPTPTAPPVLPTQPLPATPLAPADGGS